MTINKFQGKTEAEAREKAKKAMGENVVVMNVREVRPQGFFALFRASTWEVTAAVEEKEVYAAPVPLRQNPAAPGEKREGIALTADEPIKIPYGPVTQPPVRESRKEEDSEIKERLTALQSLLEKQLPKEDPKEPVASSPAAMAGKPADRQSPEFKFLRMLYGVMLEHEVDEKYANDLIEDLERVAAGGNGVDLVLSTIYQKMILKFGTPKTIEMSQKGGPKVVFFIGPTGVGKTTTIAKIASRMKVDRSRKVAFLTADTYRIAAAEQLRTYASILDAPLTVCYKPEELNEGLSKMKGYDLVLVDTAGFSHKNQAQRDDTKHLIEALDPSYDREVYLVLSATTKYRDLKEIADSYHEVADYKLLFTKLDETTSYGNLLNVRLHSGADISYTTNGQNVPEDISVFNTQRIVKQILGGK